MGFVRSGEEKTRKAIKRAFPSVRKDENLPHSKSNTFHFPSLFATCDSLLFFLLILATNCIIAHCSLRLLRFLRKEEFFPLHFNFTEKSHILLKTLLFSMTAHFYFPFSFSVFLPIVSDEMRGLWFLRHFHITVLLILCFLTGKPWEFSWIHEFTPSSTESLRY